MTQRNMSVMAFLAFHAYCMGGDAFAGHTWPGVVHRKWSKETCLIGTGTRQGFQTKRWFQESIFLLSPAHSASCQLQMAAKCTFMPCKGYGGPLSVLFCSRNCHQGSARVLAI